MHESHWRMSHSPFRNELDIGRFFQAASHEEALARLAFLVEERRQFGFLQGASGTGKSLVLRVLHAEASRTPSNAILIDARALGSADLLWSLADALRLDAGHRDSPSFVWRHIVDHLEGRQQAGLSSLLIFDHLESGDVECVRTIERLLHLGRDRSAGTTIIVVAASSGPTSRVLAGWSDLRIEVRPLDSHETHGYVRTLMEKAGGRGDVFTTEALDVVFQQSGGVPRQINRLCDLALLAGEAAGLASIDSALVRAAAAETPACPTYDDQRSLLVGST